MLSALEDILRLSRPRVYDEKLREIRSKKPLIFGINGN